MRKFLSSLLVTAIVACTANAFAAQAGTIDFSGYTWIVRPSGEGGPGPNLWAPDNVRVDENGYLHLRLTEKGGRWHCSEVYTRQRFGFGRYEFTVIGPLDRLDKNIVLGLFNYPTRDVGPDATHEIDIEFARWGVASAPPGNYTVWPATKALRQESKSFAFTLDSNSSRHSFFWTPTNVLFQSFAESGRADETLLNSWRYQPTNATERISSSPMPVHINLWCFKGRPPADGQGLEIIVRSFRFTPL